MVVERTQFLDMNMESAQVMTALGALLAEQGALKRADTLLRQALEFFWRELKGPHAAVARCYRVGVAEDGADYLHYVLLFGVLTCSCSVSSGAWYVCLGSIARVHGCLLHQGK